MFRPSRPFLFALATGVALGASVRASLADDPKAERTASAAEENVHAKARLHEIDKQIVDSLKARLPDLEALEGIAKKRLDRDKKLVESFAVPKENIDDDEVALHEASLRTKELKTEIKAAERQAVVSEFELRQAEARLERKRKSAAGAGAKAAARAAEADRLIAEAEKDVDRKARLYEMEKEELAALKAQLPGLEALQTNAKRQYDRFKDKAQKGEVPVQEFDDREAAYREAIAKVVSLQSQIKAAERQTLASEFELHEARRHLDELKRMRGDAPEKPAAKDAKPEGGDVEKGCKDDCGCGCRAETEKKAD